MWFLFWQGGLDFADQRMIWKLIEGSTLQRHSYQTPTKVLDPRSPLRWNEWGNWAEQRHKLSYDKEKKKSEQRWRKQQSLPGRNRNADLGGVGGREDDGRNFAAWQKTLSKAAGREVFSFNCDEVLRIWTKSPVSRKKNVNGKDKLLLKHAWTLSRSAYTHKQRKMQGKKWRPCRTMSPYILGLIWHRRRLPEAVWNYTTLTSKGNSFKQLWVPALVNWHCCVCLQAGNEAPATPRTSMEPT